MTQLCAQTIETVEPVATSKQFVSLVAQHSMTAEIGADLLKIKNADTPHTIRSKIALASHRHPEHLMEIMLAGLTAIAYCCESKEDAMESCIFAFGVADSALAS